MLKYFLLLLLTLSFLNADSFWNGKCVSSYQLTTHNNMIIYNSDGTTTPEYPVQYILETLAKNEGVFFYDTATSQCQIDTNRYYGLTKNQFNFLNALTGLLTAFLIVSLIQRKV